MRYVLPSAAASFLALAAASPLAAATIEVPRDFATIQAAIDAALEGDTVLVAEGVYTGPGNKGLEFSGRAITLRSAAGAATCVIDCEDDNRGLRMVGQNGVDVRIEGFTFTRGLVDTTFPGGRRGGAAVISTSSPVFVGCVFDDNIGHTGGAIYASTASAPTFINCRFTNQIFSGSGGKEDIHLGGAVYARNGADVTLINCTIADNACAPGVDHTGGGVQSSGAGTAVTLINCVVWGNTASFGDQFAVEAGATMTVRFCDVEGGEAEVFVDGGTLLWEDGNIDVDPGFVDPAGLDYGPAAGSALIDAGDGAALPAGIDTDLLGAPRFVDDPATPDTGVPGPGGAVVDIGAREFQTGAVPCPSDLGGDGETGFDDLLAVLAAWGPCAACPEDLDGDDIVGFADLLAVLAAWGPCP